MAAIPSGSLVLVTGASSYLGTHCVHNLLKEGYRVRATVRTSDKAEWIKSTFAPTSGPENIDVALVPDMAAPNAFHEAVKGASGLIHIASNLTFDADPSKVIPETVTGTTNALDAALTEPAMKRFVLCSSSYAATQPQYKTPITIYHDTYNQSAVKAAQAPPPYEPGRGVFNYAASKLLSEEAMRDFRAAKKPHFVCNAVLPDLNLGPLFPGQPTPSSGGFLPAMLENGSEPLPTTIPPSYYICVTDSARLLTIALTDASLENRRIFGYGGKLTVNKLYHIMRKISPERTFPEDDPNSVEDQNVIVEAETADALLKKHYGQGFVDLETTVRLNVPHVVG